MNMKDRKMILYLKLFSNNSMTKEELDLLEWYYNECKKIKPTLPNRL